MVSHCTVHWQFDCSQGTKECPGSPVSLAEFPYTYPNKCKVSIFLLCEPSTLSAGSGKVIFEIFQKRKLLCTDSIILPE